MKWTNKPARSASGRCSVDQTTDKLTETPCPASAKLRHQTAEHICGLSIKCCHAEKVYGMQQAHATDSIPLCYGRSVFDCEGAKTTNTVNTVACKTEKNMRCHFPTKDLDAHSQVDTCLMRWDRCIAIWRYLLLTSRNQQLHVL